MRERRHRERERENEIISNNLALELTLTQVDIIANYLGSCQWLRVNAFETRTVLPTLERKLPKTLTNIQST